MLQNTLKIAATIVVPVLVNFGGLKPASHIAKLRWHIEKSKPVGSNSILKQLDFLNILKKSQNFSKINSI